MWYNISNNTTGIINFVFALRDGMGSQVPVLGENFFGISLLISTFVIIFLPLSRYSTGGALIVSSFLCWILTVFMMSIQLVNEIAFVIFTLLLILSAIVYYMNSRQ